MTQNQKIAYILLGMICLGLVGYLLYYLLSTPTPTPDSEYTEYDDIKTI